MWTFPKVVGHSSESGSKQSQFEKTHNKVSHTPSQSAPTTLKNGAPCFWNNGAPCFLQKAGWKKQGHSLFKKRRDQAASSHFELQWPWFFALCFFQKAGCPIFKKQGARFLRIVGADWLGDWVSVVRECKNGKWCMTLRISFPAQFVSAIYCFQKEEKLIANFKVKTVRNIEMLLTMICGHF